MPLTSKRVFVALCCASVLGCAAPKQPFIDPVKSVPTEWGTVLTTSALADASRFPWWQALQSPSLNRLIDQALSQNTSVLRAIKAVELANQQLETVKLGWLPSLSVFGGRISGDTTLFFEGLPVPASNVGGFVGILPNYFVNMFRLPYEQRQAMEIVDVAQAEMLAVRAGVVGEVVTAYSLLHSARREVGLLKQIQQTLSKQRQLMKNLQSVGLASQTMLDQVAVEIAAIDGQIALVEANAAASRNALNNLVKNPLGTPHISDTVVQLDVGDQIAGQTPAAVLNVRPDIVAERGRVLAATTGIDVQAMLLAPTLEFNALRTNIDAQTADISGRANANFTAGYAALVLDPQVLGLIKSSQLEAQDALLKYVQTVDRALREVDDSRAQFQGQRRNLQSQKVQVEILARNINSLRAMQQAQLASELSVVQAKLEWLVARVSFEQAKAQMVLAFAALQQEMGIGVLYDADQLTIVDGLIEKQSDEEIP